MSVANSPLPNWGEGGGEGNIGAILKQLTKNLQNHSDAPDLDAQRIILHALGQREASYLFSHADQILNEKQMALITAMTEKRQTGMPLAYILGEADFYGRTFIVNQDVLIPRPDTEALIEKVLEYIKNNFSDKKEITIADICTGSGVIAITLALELPEAILIATDISSTALAVAKRNAERHGVANHIEFIEGDMLSPIKNRHVDLIVSNPPYIPSAELTSLFPSPYQGEGEDEVSDNAPNQPSPPPSPQLGRGGTLPLEIRGLLFEPRIALDGGADGQDFVKQIQQSGIPAIVETTGGIIIQL